MTHQDILTGDVRHSNLFDLFRIVPFMSIVFTSRNVCSLSNTSTKYISKEKQLSDNEEKTLTNTNTNSLNGETKRSSKYQDEPSIDDLLKFRNDHKLDKLNYELKLTNTTSSKSNGFHSGLSTANSSQTRSYKSSNRDADIQSIASSCVSKTARPKKILIVDDATLNRKMLWKLLTQRGHYCEQAENGLIGLNMIKEAYDLQPADPTDFDNKPYEVVVMDIVMPVMNGIDATKEIRNLGFTGPIIGITACVDSIVEDNMMKAGATTVLIKPFRTKEVYAIVDL